MAQKQTWQFSGHRDRCRRFDSYAEHIGSLASGKAAYAWRDGIFIIEEHCGASTFYVARRISIADVVNPRDTKPAREALQALVEA